jgi:hypothetical protein
LRSAAANSTEAHALPLLTNRQRNSYLWVILLFAGSVFRPEMAAGHGAPSRTTAQAPSKARAATPVTMTECEGVNNCATWTFLGAQGNGQCPSGEVANLSVERYDDNSVVIRRADSTGSSAGLTAVYTGTRRGDRVGGEFTSSWPGHWDSRSGNWYATVEAPISPPSAMRFCGANCGTLTWENGHYVLTSRNGFEAPGFSSIWTVESFTRESVILHRHDSPDPVNPASLPNGWAESQRTATVSSTEPRMADRNGFRLAWGPAINTVPGSNAERDRGQPPPQRVVVVRPGPVCFPWFFGWVCE